MRTSHPRHLYPLVLCGIPGARDLTHHSHLALAFFGFHLRWPSVSGLAADANNGYGDVSVRFYPPGLSLLLASGRLLFKSWYPSYVAVLTLLTFVGGLGAYYWAKEFARPRYALWAGVLFILSPYHINERFKHRPRGICRCFVLPFAFTFNRTNLSRRSKTLT